VALHCSRTWPQSIRKQAWCTDISGSAFAIAKQNALRHGAHVQFVESDWFTELAGRNLISKYCLNPPYVLHGDSHLATGDLRLSLNP
jgi:release factor glutamine methyltransferase